MIRRDMKLIACRNRRLGYNLTGIGGFAQAFLHAGAGPFVGGRCVIRQRATFTKVFHDALRKGKSVAEPGRKARADGDATWVAYVVCSHLQAKLYTRLSALVSAEKSSELVCHQSLQ